MCNVYYHWILCMFGKLLSFGVFINKQSALIGCHSAAFQYQKIVLLFRTLHCSAKSILYWIFQWNRWKQRHLKTEKYECYRNKVTSVKVWKQKFSPIIKLLEKYNLSSVKHYTHRYSSIVMITQFGVTIIFILRGKGMEFSRRKLRQTELLKLKPFIWFVYLCFVI